jgi:maltooligosyltrehalose synthase
VPLDNPVHANYGSLRDFKTFLREAHRRGLRVITELVINHTSDQHPWFRRARRSEPGSRWRDLYDNIYLGDRNGVRTPMQWSADRNAGFSRANPQQLYLPPIIDYEYHYESVNVQTQRKDTRSLLSWMRRLINLRQQSPALMRGSLDRGSLGLHGEGLEPIPKGVRTLACPLRGKDLRRELRGPDPFWDRLLRLLVRGEPRSQERNDPRAKPVAFSELERKRRK